MKLAISGGHPVRTELFPAYNTIGADEERAGRRVLRGGNLSQFLGAWHEDFHGGPEVRALEEAWCGMLSVEHALTVNSNTSGLFAAVLACGLGPGDEVIVPPFTMTASAIAPAAAGAVPVFADVEDRSFGLDPVSVERRLTERTRAIMVVHLFGHPAEMEPLMAIADRHGLKVIEDCAQAPLSLYRGRPVGTVGDIGVFSLNYHKHIHTGEGGIVTTNDAELAQRVSLIRNHGEAVVGAIGRSDLSYLIGQNYRMTELQAAIGGSQLGKLEGLIAERRDNAAYLDEKIAHLPGLEPVPTLEHCTHAFYLRPLRYDRGALGVHRDLFVEALRAELPSAALREKIPLVAGGYVAPLYRQPFYQERGARCSFNCPRYDGDVSYADGLCPVTERLHSDELLTHEFMRPGMRREDLDDVAAGFEKLVEHIGELRALEERREAGES